MLHSPSLCEADGIGRHGRLKICWISPSRFESGASHQSSIAPVEESGMLNDKELKNCSDDELLEAWNAGIQRDEIRQEVELRRQLRAASPYREQRDRVPI